MAGPSGVMDGLVPGAVSVPVSLGGSTPRAVRAVRSLAARADVVHAHGLTAGWVAWAAGAGPKLVVTVHNLVLDEAAGAKAPMLRALEGALPRRAHDVIVISEPMRGRFDPQASDPRFTVIPPVGPEPVASRDREVVRKELGVHGSTPLVVLVGRLHPQKDIATLIEAVPLVPGTPQVVVVGEGPQRAELQRRIEALGVGEQVRLIGARADAADYLAAADVVVLSSIWEGFGLVVAEALYLARPVVATAVGPVPSMVVDDVTGRLVPPGDPAALAAAVTDLLADPDHAADLGRAGAKLVRPHFDTDLLVGRVEDVYRNVLEQTRP